MCATYFFLAKLSFVAVVRTLEGGLKWTNISLTSLTAFSMGGSLSQGWPGILVGALAKVSGIDKLLKKQTFFY